MGYVRRLSKSMIYADSKYLREKTSTTAKPTGTPLVSTYVWMIAVRISFLFGLVFSFVNFPPAYQTAIQPR